MASVRKGDPRVRPAPESPPPSAPAEDPFTNATGSHEATVQIRFVHQVVSLMQRSPDEKQREAEIKIALSLLQGIKPAGEIEGMLATQMVATHTIAMECLRRAAIPGQPRDGLDLNLRHAERLLSLYAHQVEVLDKHRGRGQQQVAVQNVNVQSGGQAVVGLHSGPATVKPDGRPERPALADQSDTALEMDIVPMREKAPIKRVR